MLDKMWQISNWGFVDAYLFSRCVLRLSESLHELGLLKF